MASMNKDEFIAMVEGMTVLELHEIVKALEDRFGVTAAAPAVAAAAPGAAAPVAEEKTEFDVVLTGFGANKIRSSRWSASSPASAQGGQGPGRGRSQAGQGSDRQEGRRGDEEEDRGCRRNRGDKVTAFAGVATARGRPSPAAFTVLSPG